MGFNARVIPVLGTWKSKGWLRQQHQKGPRHNNKKRITFGQLFNLARRLAGVATAIAYAVICLHAASTTLSVLRGAHVTTQDFDIFEAKLIVGYAGNGLIRDSPLVQEVLHGNTTPTNEIIYLHSRNTTSFTNCGDVKMFDAAIYSKLFLNGAFFGLIGSNPFNLTTFSDLELIVSVVDCTSPPLVLGDPSLLRVYSFVRHKDDYNDVRIIGVSLSIQDYRIPIQSRSGSAALATFFSVNDMRATKVEQHFALGLNYPYSTLDLSMYTLDRVSPDGYWEMSSIQHNGSVDMQKKVETSRRRGFYFHAESAQANIRNLYPKVELDSPARALSRWEWHGGPMIIDSWAWVHGIHFFFAAETLVSLGFLSILIFRNLRVGTIWIGDAFASVSTSSLIMRAALVFASWYVNSCWTLMEFFLANSNDITGAQHIPIRSELVHADLMVLFLSVFGLIGHMTKERVDPAFAISIFELVHSYRQDILRWVQPVLKPITDYSDNELRLGIVSVSAQQLQVSPMRLWTTHKIPGIDFSFLFVSIFPKYVMILGIIGFAMARKVYHHFYPVRTERSTSGRSSAYRPTSEKGVVEQNGNLTNFELSTGAELEARYGLISDYKNYILIKGRKFASADGVYCSGYVVANGRFLVGSKDMLSIILIKMFRSRFTNVYVYAVDGDTVQRTAQLVYPETLSWQDLVSLNIKVLA